MIVGAAWKRRDVDCLEGWMVVLILALELERGEMDHVQASRSFVLLLSNRTTSVVLS